jgi:hypothetical protein
MPVLSAEQYLLQKNQVSVVTALVIHFKLTASTGRARWTG